MAGYERVVIIETVFHRKVAAPIASEHHAIIEDCHGVLYKNNRTNVAADEYYDSWPQKMINASSRPPLPPPRQQNQIMMQIKGNAILNSTEAAKRYGGFVTTEFYPRRST